ncbi:MAG: hypothetical protein LBT29_01140 [Flavobacteriaceae bacterium]|nr:hypothetical protein [Flavobacteriaceae bacterium]
MTCGEKTAQQPLPAKADLYGKSAAFAGSCRSCALPQAALSLTRGYENYAFQAK